MVVRTAQLKEPLDVGDGQFREILGSRTEGHCLLPFAYLNHSVNTPTLRERF